MVSKKAKTCPHCGEKKPGKKKVSILWMFAIICIFWMIGAMQDDSSHVSNQNTNARTHFSSAPVQQPQPVLNPESKIADHAIYPIKQGQYPKTFAKWGANGVSKINSLLKPAALHAAKSPTCDQVDMVELSDNRSVPPNQIVFFVDCTNGQRFYVSEQDIKKNAAAVSKQDKTKSVSDSEATSACVDAVKSHLQFPSSFDRKALTTSVYRAETGNIAVTFDFDAKNGIGNILPQKARCIIDDTGINPPEVSNR